MGSAAAAIPEQRLSRVLRILQDNESRLKGLGVLHLSIFGSTARGEATAESDVDVMLELDRRRNLDIFDLAGIGEELRRVVPFPLDYVSKNALKQHVATSALRDEIRVF